MGALAEGERNPCAVLDEWMRLASFLGRRETGTAQDAGQVPRNGKGMKVAMEVAEPIAGQFLDGRRRQGADRGVGEIDDRHGLGHLVAENGPGLGGSPNGDESRAPTGWPPVASTETQSSSPSSTESHFTVLTPPANPTDTPL